MTRSSCETSSSRPPSPRKVAVALRFDDARVDAQRLRMFEDPDVVAQDLNYNVMQRLFATAVLRTFNPRVRRRGGPPTRRERA